MYHFIRVVKNICTALILLLHVYTAWRSTDLADHLVFCLKTNSCYLYYSNIIFPHMVSAETIFFLNLEIKRSQYIRPKITVHKFAETIQGRKLFKGGNYMRKYGIYFDNSMKTLGYADQKNLSTYYILNRLTGVSCQACKITEM